MKSGYIYKKLLKCFTFESLKLHNRLSNYLPISNTSCHTTSLYENIFWPCSLPTLQGTVPREVQNPSSSLQECPNHFKIDMHVKESCHYWFLQIVDFYLIRYGDTAMQSKVHVSRSNRAFLSPTRENGSGSRTEKGAIRAGNVDLLCIAVSP